MQQELFDPPPSMPHKTPTSLDWCQFSPILQSSPYVCVVMVTVQGWANVQQQFNRLVHSECKPRPKEITLPQRWSDHLKSPEFLWGVERAHDLVFGVQF